LTLRGGAHANGMGRGVSFLVGVERSYVRDILEDERENQYSGMPKKEWPPRPILLRSLPLSV
jgi:hypothetical protein